MCAAIHGKYSDSEYWEGDITCRGATFQVEIYRVGEGVGEEGELPDWALDITEPLTIRWTRWPQGGRYPSLSAALEDATRQIQEVMDDNADRLAGGSSDEGDTHMK